MWLRGLDGIQGQGRVSARTRQPPPWSVEEARQFLVSAKEDGDPLYAAYVLILVLGLRRGELLGLTWPMVDLDTAQLEVGYSLQRIGGRLVHGETKTEASDAVLPLPDICLAALRLHHRAQESLKSAAGPFWIPTGYVFTTRDGLPLDPRNFHRAFKARSAKAGVRVIPVHGTHHTCGSLLAALDVHPPRRHADPATHQDRHDDGDLHPHPVRPHPDCAAPPGGPARIAQVTNCCTLLLYFAPSNHKGPRPGPGESL